MQMYLFAKQKQTYRYQNNLWLPKWKVVGRDNQGLGINTV